MAQKPDVGWKVFAGIAGMAGGFVARKSLELAWQKGTGRKPPVSPESPDVSLAEALGWAVLIGVGMEVSRVLVTRLAVKQWQATTGTLPAHLLPPE
ncbi:DUF4235 domain-containing protein [Actinocorallia sp. API 0066]|uniref:DUF4235 domain-containing protein n=1 Tax=Actinocorallia sp. API 0066 TaxID=2896846 RepID=UPI001E4CD7B7|nr:DUF4235 domain-containing protein [Actinocorallia sp. API 0066]MCD0451971.1 DUF4235 domain-containing protein [Actinocorallia sp. API 0066]